MVQNESGQNLQTKTTVLRIRTTSLVHRDIELSTAVRVFSDMRFSVTSACSSAEKSTAASKANLTWAFCAVAMATDNLALTLPTLPHGLLHFLGHVEHFAVLYAIVQVLLVPFHIRPACPRPIAKHLNVASLFSSRRSSAILVLQGSAVVASRSVSFFEKSFADDLGLACSSRTSSSMRFSGKERILDTALTADLI